MAERDRVSAQDSDSSSSRRVPSSAACAECAECPGRSGRARACSLWAAGIHAPTTRRARREEQPAVRSARGETAATGIALPGWIPGQPVPSLDSGAPGKDTQNDPNGPSCQGTVAEHAAGLAAWTLGGCSRERVCPACWYARTPLLAAQPCSNRARTLPTWPASSTGSARFAASGLVNAS